MITVREQVQVDAPLSAVFEYMDQPGNQPEITPSLVRSETLETLENGGKRVAYGYEMAGIGLDGEIRAVEYEPESYVRWEMTGDLEGEIEWEFGQEDDGTVVTYATEYEIPVPVLDAVVEPFVQRYNERELRTTLENLRTRLEHAEA